MSTPANDHRDLFARIVTCIERSGHLTEAVLSFVETALFTPAPARLASFLSDDTEFERDSLLDLIFSPDQAVQVELEAFLADARYSVDDEAALLDRLIALSISARVDMPDGRPLIRITVPDDVKSQYLARLNIAWQMDPRVAMAIERGVATALVPVVRVRLRNAGICLTPSQRVFLCRFFERMTDSDPDYLACLDLVLSILETGGEESDVYALLARHKRDRFRSLQQSRRFQTLLQRSNMETLMLQGVRTPHVSPDELNCEMRLIDLICLGIFGRTETIELPMEEPVRQVSDMDTPEAAFRALLR